MDRTREYGFRDDGDFSWTATIPAFILLFDHTVYPPFVGQTFPKRLPKPAPRILRACCDPRHEDGNLIRISGTRDEFPNSHRPRV